MLFELPMANEEPVVLPKVRLPPPPIERFKPPPTPNDQPPLTVATRYLPSLLDALEVRFTDSVITWFAVSGVAASPLMKPFLPFRFIDVSYFVR